MYYYQGASQTDTVATVGAAQTQTPQSFSRTDQKSLMTNLNMTARAFNNEYDNRLVFQDFYLANFLPGQASSQRLGAAYYEMKDRIVNYSVKIGRQSGFGGGVMGRFDGIAAGYGFGQEWRVNVVTGQLSDYSIDSKPTFIGGSLDFCTRSPLGGSVYFINQNVSGFTDRRAVGGNLKYSDQRFNVMAMLDYDTQFKELNMFTVQGTLMGGGTGTDYNFLLDQPQKPDIGHQKCSEWHDGFNRFHDCSGCHHGRFDRLCETTYRCVKPGASRHDQSSERKMEHRHRFYRFRILSGLPQ